MRDIVPVEHALERNKLRGLVRAVGGFAQGCTARGDAEHAPTSGDKLVVLHSGSGVEDVYAGQTIGLLNTCDRQTGRIAARIASAGQGQADSVAGMPERLAFDGQR